MPSQLYINNIHHHDHALVQILNWKKHIQYLNHRSNQYNNLSGRKLYILSFWKQNKHIFTEVIIV